jgi:hypothetical protein
MPHQCREAHGNYCWISHLLFMFRWRFVLGLFPHHMSCRLACLHHIFLIITCHLCMSLMGLFSSYHDTSHWWNRVHGIASMTTYVVVGTQKPKAKWGIKENILISTRHLSYYNVFEKHMLITSFKSLEGTEYLVDYSTTFYQYMPCSLLLTFFRKDNTPGF